VLTTNKENEYQKSISLRKPHKHINRRQFLLELVMTKKCLYLTFQILTNNKELILIKTNNCYCAKNARCCMFQSAL